METATIWPFPDGIERSTRQGEANIRVERGPRKPGRDERPTTRRGSEYRPPCSLLLRIATGRQLVRITRELRKMRVDTAG